MKVIKNKQRIEKLLKEKPHLRDDDKALIASIWWMEAQKRLKPHVFDQITPFLRLVANGEVSNAETIRRTRAKLQQEFVELRGESYAKRRGKEMAEAEDDLRAFEIHEKRQISLGI